MVIHNNDMKRFAVVFMLLTLLPCGDRRVSASDTEPAVSEKELSLPGEKTEPSAGPQQSRGELGKKALETVAAHLKHKDSDVRARAAEVLGEAGNRAAAGVLEKMLRDRDKYVRIAAAGALWKLGSNAGLKVIYAIINDVPSRGAAAGSPLAELKIISWNKIREKAMETLAAMRGGKAADILFKLKDDEHGPIRDAAARELARLGYEEELSQFTAALSSEDEAIRYESAVVLSRICAKGAVERLAAMLSSEKAVRVRIATLDALKCSPGKELAAAELLKLADDANPTIKYKAVSALSGIADEKIKAKLTSIATQTPDIRLRLAARKGPVQADAAEDAAAARSALNAVSPEVRLEALDFTGNLSPEQAQPLLAMALEDESAQVKLAAALQIIKRFAKK